MIKFKFTERDTEYYKRWISFYKTRDKGTGFDLTFSNNGYFDPRPQINTNLTSLAALVLPFMSLWLLPISIFFCFWSWGSLYIHLPWDTGRGNTAEYKTCGLTFYHFNGGIPDQFWVRGDNYIARKLSFYFPWHYKFLKREILLKDGWYTEQKSDQLWDLQVWGDKIKSEVHPYTYILKSGEVQDVNAKIWEEKRYWVRWFGLDIDCNHYIEIEFDKEVGERAGSWKGGTIGCSYNILPGETPLECLRRMEKERKF